MDPEKLSEEQKEEIRQKIENMSPEEIKELQKKQCIFCKIVLGEIPSTKIYEDDLCLAILDINPAAKGHLLVMPKEHYPLMPLVPENVVAHLFNVVKKLSQALLKSMNATGTTIHIANGPIAGQNAQHFMIHLIPRKDNDGLVHNPVKIVEKEILEKSANLIKTRLEEILGIKQETLPVEKEEEVKKPARSKVKKNVKKEEKDVSLDDISDLFK